MEVRAAQKADNRILAGMLRRAFENDPVMRWILPSQSEYDRVAEPFFNLILKQTVFSGSCFTNNSRSGVSLWEEPDYRPAIGSQLVSFFRLTWLFRANLTRALGLQSVMESYRPRKPFWHLTYIATDPVHQGKGIGTGLLNAVTNLSPARHRPVYLECSNRDNLPFYQAHNFRPIDEITYPGGPTIWPMLLDR